MCVRNTSSVCLSAGTRGLRGWPARASVGRCADLRHMSSRTRLGATSHCAFSLMQRQVKGQMDDEAVQLAKMLQEKKKALEQREHSLWGMSPP